MTTTNRIHWLDNLRTAMIFLVVTIHVATTYEQYSMGADWWMVVDPSDNDVAGIIFLILNMFVMATIFFVSRGSRYPERHLLPREAVFSCWFKCSFHLNLMFWVQAYC